MKTPIEQCAQAIYGYFTKIIRNEPVYLVEVEEILAKHFPQPEQPSKSLESWNKEQSVIKERDAIKLAGDELAETSDNLFIKEHTIAKHYLVNAFMKALTKWQSLTTTKKENEG